MKSRISHTLQELFIAFCAIFILPVHTAILKHMDTPSEAFLAHEARSGDDAAYKSFIANSKLHMWAVNDGVRLFIRCVVDAGVQHTEDEWPRVWAGDESRIVNCAMWVQNEDTTFTLVAVWAVSTGTAHVVEQLTVIYYNPNYICGICM